MFCTCCKNKTASKSEQFSSITKNISDKQRLELISDILKDSLFIERSRFEQTDLVSNQAKMTPPILPIDYSNPSKTISHQEFISDTLKIENVQFVKDQIVSNKNFDLENLTDYGYDVFDLKHYVHQNIEWDSINKIIEKTYRDKNKNPYSGLLHVTKPIFNKEINLAYIRTRQGAGGKTLICEKLNDKWRVKHIIHDWVE